MGWQLTVHDGRLGSQLVIVGFRGASVDDSAVSMNDSLGEAGRSGSEEEDSLGIGLGRSELEIRGIFLSVSGLLDVIEELDVQTGGTGLVELTRSDLVGQPDGLD